VARLGAPPRLPTAPLLEQGHRADAPIGFRDRGVPRPDTRIAVVPQPAQDVLVAQKDRHGISRGVTGSSGSPASSRTPACA
jgi:hypothetical protein